MDGGEPDNAASRWMRAAQATQLAQDDPARPLADWATEDFQHEDRRRLRIDGDLDAAGFENWQAANFELDRGAPEQKLIVVAQRGERLTLMRVTQGSEFFDSYRYWIFQVDESHTRLQRSIQYDESQLDEATADLDDLAQGFTDLRGPRTTDDLRHFGDGPRGI